VIVPFDEDLVFRAGRLRPLTRHAGLSFGDRACLALASRMRAPVLTADRARVGLGLELEIRVIR
jgi:ribonuclease VapC